MKAFGQAISIIAVLHLIGAVMLIGFLGATDRLSRDRVAQVKAIFMPTLTAEKQAEELAATKAKAADEEAARLARASGLGPTSVAERLTQQQEHDEMTLRQLERTRQEIEHMLANMSLTRQQMQRERNELIAARDEANQRIEAIRQQKNDEGFKATVEMYSNLPAKQVKQVFMNMMDQKQTDEVVAALEAMEPRKAAGVLREFKAVHEVTRVVELMERLRARGSDLVKQLETQS